MLTGGAVPPIRYLSVCSGIEAASVAWHPLGWRPAAFSEIDPFPRAVLAHRHGAIDARKTGAAQSGVPLWGDFTTIRPRHLRRLGIDPTIDLLVGGTPCQSFSVAGLRRGMDDARGNLALEFLVLARRLRPRWVVWENVPGVLSTRDNAFGCLLGGLAGEDGPLLPPGGKWTDAGVVVGPARTVAWRVLDAQYFGLAQRRRRVFVVAGAGDRADPVQVLFEREGVRRDHPPSREAEQGVAGTLAGGPRRRGGFSFDDLPVAFGGNNTSGPIDVSPALNACASGSRRIDFESEAFIAHTLRGEGFDASEDDPMFTLQAGARHGVAQAISLRGRDGGATAEISGDVMPSLRCGGGGGDKPHALTETAVRRLTPRECERLQGFPDVRKRIIIRVCKSEAERRELAQSAELSSAVQKPVQSRPVAVRVLIDCERQVLQLHSLGKSPLSVSIADGSASFHQRMPADAFARLVALMTTILVPATPAGRAASPLSIRSSSAPLNGSVSVLLCGAEVEGLASDAERFTMEVDRCMKSITSEAGPSSPNYEQTLATSCCCVAAAISSFIPTEIRAASSFDLSVETVAGYTLIPWRGKPADQCPDGPRYKALGNSMAVPVMAWIGQRIEMVRQILARQTEAA